MISGGGAGGVPAGEWSDPSERLDFVAIGRLMREVAAAAILPRWRNLGPGDVRAKGDPRDLVTVADIEAERRLGQELTALLPGSGVVGEEAASADPRVLSRLAGPAPVWLVDPVDGTQNFVDGSDYFAVIVGLCHGGRTVGGWILDPVSDDLVWAGAGAGAWRQSGAGGPQRLVLSGDGAIADLDGIVDYRTAKRLKSVRGEGVSPLPRVARRKGCTGREYMELARGAIGFAQYRRLKPWDHAAGILIHGEAGGFARLRESQVPYRPEPSILEATVLLAPDAAAWADLARVLG
jgi:fructose-1,6-bisphosphatase/inositol monophosphatase family enzyme